MSDLELFVRFVVISLVAFGGGQAALPLVERTAVQDTQGLTPPTLGAAVAFG
jgi:chromate transport protein ChrA